MIDYFTPINGRCLDSLQRQLIPFGYHRSLSKETFRLRGVTNSFTLLFIQINFALIKKITSMRLNSKNHKGLINKLKFKLGKLNNYELNG